MIYLGTLGRLVGIKCPASQNVESEGRYSFETTLEGKRKGQVRPIGRRTWSLQSSDATQPADIGALMSFVDGDWGSGPFNFVSADALFTNLLTPTGSACREVQSWSSNIKLDGPVDLGADGFASGSIRSDAPFSVDGNGAEMYLGLDFVPIIPGRQVTASAWVRGAGSRVRIYWYEDVTQSPSGATTGVGVGAAGWSRLHVTGMPPQGAVACRMIAVNAEQSTRPAITWTDSVQPWSGGQGCPRAVVHDASSSLTLTGLTGTYANVSYTVTEVG